MDETFADLSYLGDLHLENVDDVMPFVRSLSEKKNTITGHLVVPAWGGGTCNSEYEFLTSNTYAFFQNGSYPFFPNRDSLERETAKGLPKNIWIDTAHYLLYCYPTILQKMVDLAGADHVVFGTDAPLQGPMQMRFMAELVESLDNPQADKDKIFHRNAEKILGI